MGVVIDDIEAARVAAARQDIAAGLERYLADALASIPRLDAAADRSGYERLRVTSLLAREAGEREEEDRRMAAVVEVADGKFANLLDTVMRPTPERQAKAEADGLLQRVDMKEKIEGTVRIVTTVRVGATRLIQLYRRGIIDSDLLAACKWYRDTWEIAGYHGYRLSRYGQALSRDSVPDPSRGDRQHEAREDYRWAKQFVPDDVRGLFELIVLEETSLSDAAKSCRCRYANAVAAFRRGALELHGGISSRLLRGNW